MVSMHELRSTAATFPPSRQPRMPWNRFNNLIDGVYAFSATLLMLNLSVPDYQEGRLGSALADQTPEYLLYVLGFVQIIGAWSVLRRIASWTSSVDFYGTLLAFVALLTWATTPFTIQVMSEAVGNQDDFVSALRMLAAVLLVSMASYSALFLRLERGGFFREGLHPEVFAVARAASLIAWIFPLASILLSFAAGVWAIVPIVVLVALTLVPIEAMATEQYAEVE